MSLISFIFLFAIVGTASIWVVFGIEFIVGLIVKFPNKVMTNILYVLAFIFLGFAIFTLFWYDLYSSFWWWVGALIFGGIPFLSVFCIEDSCIKYRCPYCLSWGVVSNSLVDASWKRNVETTTSVRTTEKYKVVNRTITDKGEKAAKVFKSLTQCHCKKCDAYFEWWSVGGSSDIVPISKDRFEKSYMKRYSSGVEKRSKHSIAETIVFLYDDNATGQESDIPAIENTESIPDKQP